MNLKLFIVRSYLPLFKLALAKVAVVNQLVNGVVVSDKYSLVGQVDKYTIDTSAGESIDLRATEPRQIRSSIQIFLQKLIPSTPMLPLSIQGRIFCQIYCRESFTKS